MVEREERNALDAIPGKHRKSAEVIEREEDALRSDAKERERPGSRRWSGGKLEVLPGGGT